MASAEERFEKNGGLLRTPFHNIGGHNRPGLLTAWVQVALSWERSGACVALEHGSAVSGHGPQPG